MRKVKCKAKDCPNYATAFSEKCGLHTSSKQIVASFKKHNEKVYKEKYFASFEVEDFEFTNKTFDRCQLLDLEFSLVEFANCIFKDCYFANVHFIDCRFLMHQFLDCDFHNCEFEACILEQPLISKGTFIECSFYEANEFKKATIHNLLFIGSNIAAECTFNDARITSTRILQSTISDCEFKNTAWVKCEFQDTILFSNNFHGSQFQKLIHDFGIGTFPKLNVFSKTNFTETVIPREVRYWNSFRIDLKSFLLKIIDKVGSEKHPNNLPVLSKALEKLEGIGFVPNLFYINIINGIFRAQFERAGSNADFRTVGEVISEYGRIPANYKITGFALPAPQSKQAALLHEASLTVYFEMPNWTIKNVARLFNFINDLGSLLPESETQIEVADILKGSFLVTLYGDLKQLLYSGRLMNEEKLEIEIEDAHIEKELKLIELEKAKESLKITKKENAQRLKKSSLENENLELDVLRKKLELLKTLENQFGYNFGDYIATSNGLIAEEVASKLNQEFPILGSKLKIMKSRSKRP